MKQALLFILFFYLSTDISFGAAMLMRIQQMKAMKQRQAQEEYQAEYQQYLLQTGQATQGPQGPQAPAAPLTYQQQIDQRNQAIAQAIEDAHNKAVTEGTGNTTPVLQPSEQQTIQNGIIQQYPAGALPDPSKPQGDTVDLSEVWKKLDTKSTVWAALDDDQAKLLTVSEYIGRFQKEGVKINEPPAHYAQMIDQVSKDNPQMLQRPFGELLKVLAIVDYDFDNGLDKDDLARKVLGDEGYEANKKRFAQQAQPPQPGT